MDSFYIWMEAFSKKQIEKANKTYHKYGFKSSIPAKYIIKMALKSLLKDPNSLVLDYGAGKDPKMAKMLKNKGFSVVAHDIGDNQTHDHHKKALNNKYDMVIAHNVLNIQDDKSMLNKSLEEIKDALKHGGLLIASFPDCPKELDVDRKEFMDIFKLHFSVLKFKNLKSGGIILKAQV